MAHYRQRREEFLTAYEEDRARPKSLTAMTPGSEKQLFSARWRWQQLTANHWSGTWEGRIHGTGTRDSGGWLALVRLGNPPGLSPSRPSGASRLPTRRWWEPMDYGPPGDLIAGLGLLVAAVVGRSRHPFVRPAARRLRPGADKAPPPRRLALLPFDQGEDDDEQADQGGSAGAA